MLNVFSITELYVLTRVPKHMKQSSKELKEEIGKSTLTAGDFNLLILERKQAKTHKIWTL